MAKITILIVDDHKLVRESWTSILNNDPRFKVVAACGDAKGAVKLAKEKTPCIIIMDINLPPFSGIEATRKLKSVAPDCKVIGLSMHAQPAYAKKMFHSGAMGYVTKNSSKEEMIEAILEVNRGNKFICEEIKNSFSEQSFEDNPLAFKINKLTEREIQIINFIKQGLSSRDIAASLQIRLATVEAHRYNIFKKLKMKNAASLVNFVHKNSVYF